VSLKRKYNNLENFHQKLSAVKSNDNVKLDDLARGLSKEIRSINNKIIFVNISVMRKLKWCNEKEHNPLLNDQFEENKNKLSEIQNTCIETQQQKD